MSTPTSVKQSSDFSLSSHFAGLFLMTFAAASLVLMAYLLLMWSPATNDASDVLKVVGTLYGFATLGTLLVGFSSVPRD